MKILLADFHKYVGYSGGIERVLSNMAAGLAERGHEVTAVFADEKEGAPFYPMPKGSPVYNLYRFKPLGLIKQSYFIKGLRELLRPISREAARDQNYRMLRRATKHLRRILELERPDIIVSFREPTTRLLIQGVKTTIPVVSMLHNDPEEIFRGMPHEERKALMESVRVQVLLPSFEEKARRLLHYENRDYEDFVVIPNAVAQSEKKTAAGAARKEHLITCVGRLTGRTKRQHILVEAFGKLAADFPDWHVELWGDTYDKAYVAKLKEQIKAAGLTDRVKLCGVTKDMAAVYARTDIFAFPSHHEGFPLALTEAMACGIPAVGFKECPAVNELIRDRENGFLCEEGVDAFAEALRALMEEPELRRDYGKAAAKEMEKYSPELVWDAWDALLTEAAGRDVSRKTKKEKPNIWRTEKEEDDEAGGHSFFKI